MNATGEFISCLTSTISTLRLLESLGFICLLLLVYIAGLTITTYLYCKDLNKRIDEDIKQLKENKGD